MSNRAGYDIRAAKPEDLNFVRASFRNGLYYGNSWFNLIPYPIFKRHYRPVIEAIIAKNDVWVACLKDDPDVILGYGIVSKDFTTIHWTHVKDKFRKMGIARALLPQYPVYITHLTAVGKLLMPKFENCVFNPFQI